MFAELLPLTVVGMSCVNAITVNLCILSIKVINV